MDDFSQYSTIQGRVLISQPFINDGWFKRTVVLMAEHNSHGSLGFVMNKPMHLRVKDVLPAFPEIIFPVYNGGPVAQNQLFFIHKFGEEVDGSMPVGDGVFWGGDFLQLMALIKKRKAGFFDTRFFVGYSGWDAGQLNNELDENAWFVQQADYKNILSDKPLEMWGNELKRMGSNYAVLANFPEDPSLN